MSLFYTLSCACAGISNADIISAAKNYNFPAVRKNDLNITSPDDNPNAILKMEVELRDKNQPAKKRGKNKGKQFNAMDMNVVSGSSVDLPMEKVTNEIASRRVLCAYCAIIFRIYCCTLVIKWL